MAVTHVHATPPAGAASDWSVPQNWERFTKDEHRTWDMLVDRQANKLAGLACAAFFAGIDILELSQAGIPHHVELNDRLRARTGWEVVAVPGVIPIDTFFHHLSNRRFPAANFLRAASSLDYSEEPDLFHDLFGHLPMLTDPDFADFMVAYGNAGLRAMNLNAADLIGRLYLHTVEFGLVREGGGLRGFGAGLLSSYAETVHALTSQAAYRIELDLSRVMRTDYPFDTFQPTYFVIESFESLLRIAQDTNFKPIYDQFRDQRLLAPGERCKRDRLVQLPPTPAGLGHS